MVAAVAVAPCVAQDDGCARRLELVPPRRTHLSKTAPPRLQARHVLAIAPGCDRACMPRHAMPCQMPMCHQGARLAPAAGGDPAHGSDIAPAVQGQGQVVISAAARAGQHRGRQARRGRSGSWRSGRSLRTDMQVSGRRRPARLHAPCPAFCICRCTSLGRRRPSSSRTRPRTRRKTRHTPARTPAANGQVIH